MKAVICSAIGLSLVSVGLCNSAMAGRPPPPVCPVVKCEPNNFVVFDKVYGCPKELSPDSPIEGSLECVSTSQHSMFCEADPVEVSDVCGSSGTNLVYEWSVTLGGYNYPYPPSYDSTLSVSCTPLEIVSVDVLIWNGMYPSYQHFGMRCGDDPE